MNSLFQDDYHIVIPPVDAVVKRPLWSVLIPTYNCAAYLKETLLSVLAQDAGPEHMEIIVIDDYSTEDDPESVVNSFGRGRVQFLKQPTNVGKVKNYEVGLIISKGLLIHQLHGDDKVRLGFYKEMERIFNTYQDAKAAFCRTIYIDELSRWTGMTGMIDNSEGIVTDMASKLYTQQYIQTPSMVVKRQVYEELGGFDKRLICMEDWEMWTRIANYFPIAVSNKVLAEYRSHSGNATHLTFNDGSAFNTHQLVCDIIDTYILTSIKNKYGKIRNVKQTEFWLLSYSKMEVKLTVVQKLGFIKKILSKSISLKTIYRLL